MIRLVRSHDRCQSPGGWRHFLSAVWVVVVLLGVLIISPRVITRPVWSLHAMGIFCHSEMIPFSRSYMDCSSQKTCSKNHSGRLL